MKIRTEQLNDVAAIAHVHALAFNRDNEAHLVDCLRRSPDFIPELSLVAEMDSAIVGHILFTYATLTSMEPRRIITLAPLAVLPTHQRRGIGGALIEAGLAIVQQRAEPLVTVLGHPQYYTRFGFEPANQYGVKPPFEVPEDAFMIWRSSFYTSPYQGIVMYPDCFNQV